MNARGFLISCLVAAGATGLGCAGCEEDQTDLNNDPRSECIGDDCSEPIDDPIDSPNNPFDDFDPDDPNNCSDAEICDCTLGPDGGFCLTDYCGVIMEPGVLTQEEEITLKTIDAPSRIEEDVLGPRACSVSTIDSKPTVPFEVVVGYDQEDIVEGFEETEIIGVHIEPRSSLAGDTALDVHRNRVSFSAVRGGIVVAATLLPEEERVEDVLGIPDLEVDDPTTFAYNLSQYYMSASAFDGEKFYLANGPRVMIWNDGVPSDPTTPPDVLLGRPDFETQYMLPSPSAFSASASAIWTDGEKLAVAEGNRILIWEGIPEESFAPADIVLGFDTFTGYAPNRGLERPTAGTLFAPEGIWSDGEKFVVADALNHRFLIWNSFPKITGQKADLVLGQQDFDENVINGGQLPAYQAWGVYSDGERLAVASRFACECIHVYNSWPTENNQAPDYEVGYELPITRVDPVTFNEGNSLSGFGEDGLSFRNGGRVSIWREWPTETRPADITLGKSEDTLGGVLGDITASSFGSTIPYGHVNSSNGKFFVGDGRRVLIWNELPEANFAQADLEIGQPTFSILEENADYRGIRANRVAQATDVSTAPGVTVVADRGNNRVLILRGTDPFASPEITILGQDDPKSYFPNRWTGADANTLASPTGVWTDGEMLAVADSGNHRVLIWNELPTQNGEPADVVLGHDRFDSDAQNGGLGDQDGDGDFDASASTLHYPGGVFSDGTRLFVADTYNHRVLVWNTIPTTSGTAADDLIGQPDMSSNEPNRGLGFFARDADTLARPVDVQTLPDGTIAIADSENNRVLIFDTVGANAAATAVLGQINFVGNLSPDYMSGPNIGAPRPDYLKEAAANTLRKPWSIDWTGDTLLVADRGNNRVLEFDVIATGASASVVYGQPDFETRAANEESVTRKTLRFPQGVATLPSGERIIVDTENNRVLGYVMGTTADHIFGQNLFYENGLNGASPALDSINSPGGIALEAGGKHLWVADKMNHRIVRYEGRNQVLVLGQEERGDAALNGGNPEPVAWSFNEPTDVWTDGDQLIVADRGNNRVLIWNTVPTTGTEPADVVLGQTNFSSGETNAGGDQLAGRNTLASPEGVYVDDEGVLYVSDSANNRVLVWEQVPNSNGAPADRVICQADFNENQANRATGDAIPNGCSGPTDVLVVGKHLWIADSRNNRVVRYETAANSNSSADIVLGQPSLTDRLPNLGEDYPSAATMTNPVRIEYDGRTFWVVDRGNNRALKWDVPPTQTFTPASQVLGQEVMDTAVPAANTEGLASPYGIAVMPGAFNQTYVWISDSDRNRVIVFEHVARPF